MVWMRGVARGRRRRGTLSGVLLVVCAAVLLAGGLSALASSGAPPVPACYSGTGECEGIFLKAPIAPVKEIGGKHGIFKLTSAAPLQFTKPVSCGDAGCLYNHLNWSIGGTAKVLSGCDGNDSACEVQIAGGGPWVPVLVNQNDYPVNLFILWAPGKNDHTISGRVETPCRCSGLEGVTVRAHGKHTGQTLETVTDPNGRYELTGPKDVYRVTAHAHGFIFHPPMRRVDLTGDRSGENFQGCSGAASTATFAPRGKFPHPGNYNYAGFTHGECPMQHFVFTYSANTARVTMDEWSFAPPCLSGGKLTQGPELKVINQSATVTGPNDSFYLPFKEGAGEGFVRGEVHPKEVTVAQAMIVPPAGIFAGGACGPVRVQRPQSIFHK